MQHEYKNTILLRFLVSERITSKMVIHSSKTRTNKSFTDTTRGVKTRVADNAPGREKIAFFGGGSLVALCTV